ncbi:MAG: caspase family protein [Treponema sp.]|jgi:hypothetical protein|nr:caspase family protein [Treponema sp.]
MHVFFVLVLFCLGTIFSGQTGAEEAGQTAGNPWFDGTRRFGIFIGSNNGGRGRVMLRYAVSDAGAVSRVFTEMGGIYEEDKLLLIEPSVGEINRQIGTIREQAAAARQNYKRTELVFYYSGHSDEEGLLLNRERYAYKDLRERINQIPSDMRIVILDSCSSGAFTRAKGGVKTQPFLVDSSLSAEGYAFLSSSSAAEASQESDSIKSSYFTHSLVAGLRGAADTVGDGRVTLNELYRFAYTETLAKTETSVYGVQHPSYDMQISGTGDVVLTDVKETSAGMVIAPEVTGRLSIRDASDYLAAEITKTGNRPMELGLEPGLYRITLQRGDRFYRAELFLEQNSRASLTMDSFTPITPIPAQARGEDTETTEADWAGTGAAEDGDLLRKPVDIQLVPGMGILGFGTPKGTHNFLLGIIGAAGDNLNGAALGTILINNAGMVRGAQIAGIYTTVGKDLRGLQAAGIFNRAQGGITGVQGAGIFNITQSGVEGAQVGGIFNMTQGGVEGLQVGGIFNYAGGDFRGLQAAGVNRAEADIYGLQAGLVNIGRGSGGGSVQIGLVNISQNERVVPIGLVNVVKGGLIHPAVYYDDMEFINFSFASGTKHIYSILSLGTQRISLWNRSVGIGKKGGDSILVYRLGLGTEFSLGKRVFLDFDVTSGAILDLSALDKGQRGIDFYNKSTSVINQARLSLGFKAFEHLGIFGGLSYDYIHRHRDTSPDPQGGRFAFAWSDERNIHKLGIFGGLRF